MSGLKFYQQKSTKRFEQRKTHKNIGHLKIGNRPPLTCPSLQPIPSWNDTDSPLSSDDFVITVSVQSKNSEPQSTITKFNIKNANWQLFTSNQTWKPVTVSNRSQSLQSLTKIKKKSKFLQNLL